MKYQFDPKITNFKIFNTYSSTLEQFSSFKIGIKYLVVLFWGSLKIQDTLLFDVVERKNDDNVMS